MNLTKENLINSLTLKKVIFRIITSWLLISCIYLFTVDDYNDLSIFQNTSIFLSLLFIIISFISITFISIILTKYNIDSKIIFFITLLFVTLLILKSDGIDEYPYELLAVSLILVIISIFSYNDNKELINRIKISKKALIIIIVILSTISFIITLLILIFRYKGYISPNFDFGIFVNSFYNMKRTGRPLIACERDVLQSHFKVHLSPIFYVFLPMFIIFPYPETIQGFQAFSIAIGIVPLILILLNKKMNNNTILLIAILYLFSPVLVASNSYDFHENSFLPFILLFMFYFIENKKIIPFFIFLTLLLTVKEDAAFYGLIIGLFLIFNKKEYVKGIITVSISLIYFFIAIAILNNLGNGAMTNRYDNLIYDSNSGILGMLKTFINNPGYSIRQIFKTNNYDGKKLLYVIELLIPLGFMPIIIKKPSYLILLIPLLLNLLTMYSYQYNINFQYSYGIIAFLFYLTLLNIDDINTGKDVLVIISLSTTFIFYLAISFSFLSTYVEIYKDNKQARLDYKEAIKLVPKDSTVSASTFILPHMADRLVIYEEYYHRGKTDTDYIVMDHSDKDFTNIVKTYINKGYITIFETENVIVLKYE